MGITHTVHSESEISEAIQACAQECLKETTPTLECVEAHVQRLKAKGWQELDLKQFRMGTLYVLAYLTKDDSLLPKL